MLIGKWLKWLSQMSWIKETQQKVQNCVNAQNKTWYDMSSAVFQSPEMLPFCKIWTTISSISQYKVVSKTSHVNSFWNFYKLTKNWKSCNTERCLLFHIPVCQKLPGTKLEIKLLSIPTSWHECVQGCDVQTIIFLTLGYACYHRTLSVTPLPSGSIDASILSWPPSPLFNCFLCVCTVL